MSDSIVRHRLFWSFFILSTEKWLGAMAASGFYLRDLNYKGRFLFERGEPGKSRYTFAYAKFENVQSRKAKHSERGWEEVSHHERWRVYRSGTDSSILPNRRGLYLRNNSLLCLYALISSITLLVVFSVVFGIFAYLSNADGSSEAFFQGAIGIIGVFAILLLANFVLFLRMSVANNHILEQPVAAQTPEKAYRQYLRHKTFEDWLEKLLIRDGDIVRRTCLFWISSQHGLEKWLARMESKGFNVYKVHKTGMLFYFIKSAPRSIRYCVVNSEGEDISQYLQTGWRVVYTSGGKFTHSGRIVLLSIAYSLSLIHI